MLSHEDIKALLQAALPDAHIELSGEGGKYSVTVVTDAFIGKRPVAKQQMIYAPLNAHIASGEIHAISMQTFTQEEWRKVKLFS